MDVFGITDKGKIRQENQDSYLIRRLDDKEERVLAVVCDGMGGARAGNIASDLAVRTFAKEVRERLSRSELKRPDNKLLLSQSVDEANSVVYGYSCFDNIYTGMGTTLVAALFTENGVSVVNVGDSRAYKISKSKLVQISRDHSLVQEMVDKGEITPEEAREHPRRNVITRALGVDAKIVCDVFTPRMQKGERLLLCSDGLTNMITDEELLTAAKKYPDSASLGQSLMDTALERGARDNVTIIIATR